MDSVDRVRLRIVDAIATGVVSLVVAAFASALIGTEMVTSNAFSTESYAILLSLSLFPLGMTLLGWGIAVFRAGPFGFFGFLLEWAGVNSLIRTPNGADLGVITFGATLVVFGAFVWSWKPVLEYVLRSRNQGPPPRGGAR